MILNRKIPILYFLKKIKKDVLTIALFSIIIHFLTDNWVSFKLPLSFGAFLGTAISLLLSFKLSQSYDRWWEARKIWGTILIDARILIVQIKNYCPEDAQKTILLKRIAYRQIAWHYALSRSLRGQEVLSLSQKFLNKEELEDLKKYHNIPLAMLDKQSRDVMSLYKEGLINEFQQIQIDQTISNLGISMGRAERIKNTAFPKTYRWTLHLFVYMFLLLLSLSFSLEDYNMVYIPLLICISVPFFLLEKIAYDMQDPFENKPTDTAMTAISTTLEINIKELIGDSNLPKSPSSDTFYML